MSRKYIFTSESVSDGHPDKMADQISDAVLDALLKHDTDSRVACETLVKSTNSANGKLNHHVILAGEVGTLAKEIDYDYIVRETIAEIGYDSDDKGFDFQSVAIQNLLNQQSPDIALGVTENQKEQGAGDQGLMFGFACNETDVYMPFPITYAHRLVQQQSVVRKKSEFSWIGPDAKSQVSVIYENDRPVSLAAVVLSTQHAEHISEKQVREAVIENIIKPIIPKDMISKETEIFVNPTGRFVDGGPKADCGLTGRKIIVDTYGGYSRHGGGAFSGKDPSKVDRSAAYAARYVAKNIVAAELADRCEVQVAYAIGVAKPVSLMVNTFGTGKSNLDDEKLSNLVSKFFDLRPRKIIESLDLKRPIYKKTASYGHFGRTESEFTWEHIDKVNELKQAAN